MLVFCKGSSDTMQQLSRSWTLFAKWTLTQNLGKSVDSFVEEELLSGDFSFCLLFYVAFVRVTSPKLKAKHIKQYIYVKNVYFQSFCKGTILSFVYTFARENYFYLLCLTFEESKGFTCIAIKKGFYQNVRRWYSLRIIESPISTGHQHWLRVGIHHLIP